MPHGVPTTAELVNALRTFLEEEVAPGSEGRLRYMARVAGNVAATVERELTLGPDQARARAARLATLGVASEAELAAAIRAGALDDRLAEVVAVTRANVADRVRLWNPRYLEPEDAA